MLVARWSAWRPPASGALVDVRRTRAEDSLWRGAGAGPPAPARARQPAGGRRRGADPGGGPARRRRPVCRPVPTPSDWEIDPVSGLLRERHLPVLLQQVVAAARRKVQPVSVVFWELDGLDGAEQAATDQALTALGAVAWRTLRESDAVFRLGDVVAVGGARRHRRARRAMVAERVRDALRASPVGDSLTVSAGIACYPPHALDAAELVARAGRALELARSEGHERDHVAIAVSRAPAERS